MSLQADWVKWNPFWQDATIVTWGLEKFLAAEAYSLLSPIHFHHRFTAGLQWLAGSANNSIGGATKLFGSYKLEDLGESALNPGNAIPTSL